MITKRHFLDVDCELLVEENPSHRVLMKSPEKLIGVSADELWHRIVCGFGKCEVETWVAESIIAISMKAAAEGEKFADFSEISNATVIYDNSDLEEWEITMRKDSFRKRFCHLPIFMILKESEDVTILDFIPKIP